MLPKHSIFRNALLLTAIDLLLRGISMSFQIYLSGVIGAAGLGLLQLVAAVGTLGMTLGLSGVRTAAMYLCAEEYGKRRPGGMRHVMRLCILWSGVFSILTSAALWGFSDQLAAVWLKDLRAASGLRILALSLPVECLVCVLCGYFTACGKLRRLACVEVAERLVSLALTFLLLRLSTAEATSPLPAAEATVANSRQSSAQKTSSFPRFRIFIINYSPFHSSTNTTDRTSCSVTGCETADTTAS